MAAAGERASLSLASAAAGSAGGTFEQFGEGLSSQEAARRLQEDGPNILDTALKQSFVSILLTQMKNVIFLLTSFAAFTSYMMGETLRPCILIGIVTCVCTLNAIGEYSGQDPGAALREQMAAEPVPVVRSGHEVHVQVQDLVVGDIVKIKMGDMVPADMLVLQSTDLQTNESMLTGEPTEQAKTVEPRREGEAFPSNMLYSGTCVVSGKGKGEVVAIGMHTQVGLIAKRLKPGDVELNPLQKSINLLGMAIGGICMVVIVLATSASYATGYQNPMQPCPDDDDYCFFMTSLSRGLIMAVAIIPHGLPFVVMIMLRVGSREMAVRHAMVTKRTSVDYLGATSVVCTDKTGTLTQGKMTAQMLCGLCRTGAATVPATEFQLEFYPLEGLSPNGGIFEAGKISPEARARMDARFDPRQTRQVFAEPGLADLGAEEGAALATPSALLTRAHLACGFLNCYSTQLSYKDDVGIWETSGNMTEAAVKVAAAKGGLWDDAGPGAEMLEVTHAPIADLEVPFTSKRKMSATLHALPQDRTLASLEFRQGTTHCAVLKGAPEQLIPHLRMVLAAGGASGRLLVPGGDLSAKEREWLEVRNGELGGRALRSLLVAVCPLSAAETATLSKTVSAEERLEQLLRAPGLCFLSLWGIYDPPRASVPASVQECHKAGIRVVMITGDQRTTAVAIAKQVHIIREGSDPERCSAMCKELHESSRPVHVTRTSSKRLSEQAKAILERSPTRLWTRVREALADPVALPPLARQLSAVHDARTEEDTHEPSYRPSEELAELSGRVNVWARAQPTDKVALVDSLMQQGYITAMTGDGVNDAPALKRADAGVAMGISGTAVAKNASDLILLDDNFSTIVAAIKEGRRIYNNTQKYVTFNLSVKAGEGMCLMWAIVLGVPMPIHGLQLLLNVVATHIIPTISMAFEPAEPYLMEVPPRVTKGDLVVSRVMWIYRWLPFVIIYPLNVICMIMLGVWTHTGFVYGNSLIGSSHVLALEQGKVACEIGGALDHDKRFIEDAAPFHCRCLVHSGGVPFTAVTAVEQWGRLHSAAELASAFDRWTGSTGDVFDKNNTPWKDGHGAFLEPCADHNGIARWCWLKAVPEEGRPLLPVLQTCAAYGATLGQSMSYVVMQIGEILTLFTSRTDDPFFMHLFTNTVFLGFLAFNLTVFVVFFCVPPVTAGLQLAPLTAPRLGLALCFAFGQVLVNELVKIVYRVKMRAHNQALRDAAAQRYGDTSPTPTEI